VIHLAGYNAAYRVQSGGALKRRNRREAGFFVIFRTTSLLGESQG